ncbi:MAG: universal stress protein [Solirubrobacterales bacterium]|nr:universal stress protein [Solirubrobacterales bacterium]MBV9717466.1 universal stress protein [Solirubrobacterales bacterium]
MPATAIISYDDTLNDQDALALGRVLSELGAGLVLAYVRHTHELEDTRERLEEHEAEALLERGARWLGDLDVERRVVVSGSTGEGLKWLAEREDADLVVFGSDYRTAAGHVSPQRSAQILLEGGTAAVAIAPANYRSTRQPHLARIGVLADPRDEAATETARELAENAGATVSREPRQVDLLVVGSRAEAPHGRVMISSQAQRAIDEAVCPVLVIPHGVSIRFAAHAAV